MLSAGPWDDGFTGGRNAHVCSITKRIFKWWSKPEFVAWSLERGRGDAEIEQSWTSLKLTFTWYTDSNNVERVMSERHTRRTHYGEMEPCPICRSQDRSCDCQNSNYTGEYLEPCRICGSEDRYCDCTPFPRCSICKSEDHPTRDHPSN